MPDRPSDLRYFDCTSTPGLAVADGVFALSSTVSAVTIMNQSEAEYEDENDGANRNVAGGFSIALAAVSAASGIYGIIQSERCRHAKRELRGRLLAPSREQHKLPTKPPEPRESTPAGPLPAPPAPPPSQIQPPAPSEQPESAPPPASSDLVPPS